MNFFEAQDQARKKTLWLILLFTLAVVGLILLTNLFLLSIFIFVKTNQVVFSPETLYYYYTWKEFTLVSVGVCLFILGGSAYKSMSLSGGGPAIAEMLGGRLVSHTTGDLDQRQLLNVVEEMAIAAGMPIPQVYLLDDSSINAFAAGLTPASAVIGVTRGTLMRLNREELQGVIAHEFSHIANGDMRLNIRLVGILHGILLIGLIGYLFFRALRFAGSTRSSKGIGVYFLVASVGLGLMIIGYAGSFFGQWIKAVVSRQREYLADSSAVQFTRNKDGIAGALKKIGGTDYVGSCLDSPSAPEYSHAYFAEGISSFMQAWFATHPPLEDRIRKIEPRWNGKFLNSEIRPAAVAPPSESAKPDLTQAAVVAAVLTSAEQAISQVGSLNEQNIEYVHQLIAAMPQELKKAAQDPYSARAVIYSVLTRMQKDPAAALGTLDDLVEWDMLALAKQYLPEVQNLDDRFMFPLLELGVNALRELSPNQFVQFKIMVEKIIVSDKSVNLREWIVRRFVIQQLDEHFGFRKPAKAKHASLDAVRQDVAVILSLIACIEHKDEENAGRAFASAAAESGLGELAMIPASAFKLAMLDRALDNLMQLRPLTKPRLLKACVTAILEDGKPTVRGTELVRTISSCLDCPMPPLRIG
ncbi:MAG: M48 family metallopeptidase [Gammaproteobacteria bacterium]|nr:M48 family metallopeptidase [Gammaproteobacteria bacterium]